MRKSYRYNFDDTFTMKDADGLLKTLTRFKEITLSEQQYADLDNSSELLTETDTWKHACGREIASEASTSTTTTAVAVDYTVVNVVGVYLATDTGKTGTNYYSAGSSFSGVDITLATALPTATTAVIVDYSTSETLLTGSGGAVVATKTFWLAEDVMGFDATAGLRKPAETFTDKVIKLSANVPTYSTTLMAAGTVVSLAFYDSTTLLETKAITLAEVAKDGADDHFYLPVTPSMKYCDRVVVTTTLVDDTNDYQAAVKVSFEATATMPVGAEFSIAAEAGDAIVASIQLIDENGDDTVGRHQVTVYLADDAEGDTISTSAEGLAIGTDGILLGALGSTNAAGVFVTENDGDLDISISETTGADYYYLVVLLPNGYKSVSPLITFAA